MEKMAELIAFAVEPGRVELRPGGRSRAWMDATPNAFAYRCVPLATANEHGWEMVCPFGFEVTWSGGPAVGDLTIRLDEGATPRDLVQSHFSSGILTFNPMMILRTAPETNLWVSGPPNYFKDGIQPLSALVETDWMPFTFSMSWQVTRPNVPIRFEKGEPFCFFFPVPRGGVGACEPRLATLSEDPALEEQYRWAVARRELDDMMAEAPSEKFQSWYRSGKLPKRDSGEAPSHETRIVARPFQRR